MTAFVDSWKMEIDQSAVAELANVEGAVSALEAGLAEAGESAGALAASEAALGVEAERLATASKKAATETARMAASLGITEKEAGDAKRSLDRLAKEEAAVAAAARKMAGDAKKAAAALRAVGAAERRLKLENTKKAIEGLGKGMQLSFLSGEMLSSGYLAVAVAASAAAFAVGALLVKGMRAYIASSAEATDASLRITEAQKGLMVAIGGAALGADGGVKSMANMAEMMHRVTAVVSENEGAIRSLVVGGVEAATLAFQAWTVGQQAALTPMAAVLDVVIQLSGWWVQLELKIVGGVARIAKAFGIFTDEADALIAKTDEWGARVESASDITTGFSVHLAAAGSSARGMAGEFRDAVIGTDALGTALSDAARKAAILKKVEDDMAKRAGLATVPQAPPKPTATGKSRAQVARDAAEAERVELVKAGKASQKAIGDAIVQRQIAELAASDAQLVAIADQTEAIRDARVKLKIDLETIANDEAMALWQIDEDRRQAALAAELAHQDEVTANYNAFSMGLTTLAIDTGASFAEAWLAGDDVMDGLGAGLLVSLGGLLKQLGVATLATAKIGQWFQSGGAFLTPGVGVALGAAALGLGIVLSGAGKAMQGKGEGGGTGGGASRAASTSARNRRQDQGDRDSRQDRPIILMMDRQKMGEALRRDSSQAARRGQFDATRVMG